MYIYVSECSNGCKHCFDGGDYSCYVCEYGFYLRLTNDYSGECIRKYRILILIRVIYYTAYPIRPETLQILKVKKGEKKKC